MREWGQPPCARVQLLTNLFQHDGYVLLEKQSSVLNTCVQDQCQCQLAWKRFQLVVVSLQLHVHRSLDICTSEMQYCSLSRSLMGLLVAFEPLYTASFVIERLQWVTSVKMKRQWYL